MIKNISLIGSTGSIGRQALKIIRNHPDKFRVAGLTAHTNTTLLIEQIKEFKPLFVGVTSDTDLSDIKSALPHGSILECGQKALTAAASLESADTVLLSVVGVSGLTACEEALKHKKNLALANKESLVVGGDIIMNLARRNDVLITPVDSEHSAVMQCLAAGRRQDLKRIILTCSGGAFRDVLATDLPKMKASDALKHPTWNMGAKITIDCATLMNKGLEIIEARYLFDFERIDYVLHKESVIHSMVEFADNTVIANLSYPTMELPIQYALSVPERINSEVAPLDFAGLGRLTFGVVDEKRFPCIRLAVSAMREGSGATAVLNAANEVAVARYLRDEIGFCDIPRIISSALEHVKYAKPRSVADLLDIDTAARAYITNGVL